MSELTEIPVRLCCGQRHLGPTCLDGLVMCCLCFARFPVEMLSKDAEGKRENVCLECAEEERRALNERKKREGLHGGVESQ